MNRSLIGTIIIAVSLIICVMIGSNAIIHRNDGLKTIAVKGQASRTFKSDLAVFTLTLTNDTKNVAEDVTAMQGRMKQTTDFLKRHGITEDEIEYGAVTYNDIIDGYYDKNAERYIEEHKGYRVTQSVTITSRDVDKVDAMSKSVGELLEVGLQIQNSTPDYYYTGLTELKHEMLADAAADARQRAEQIAGESMGELSGLKNASMGVFQILGKYSNEEYSWGGTFNTGSIEKTATITVTSTFLLK